MQGLGCALSAFVVRGVGVMMSLPVWSHVPSGGLVSEGGMVLPHFRVPGEQIATLKTGLKTLRVNKALRFFNSVNNYVLQVGHA